MNINDRPTQPPYNPDMEFETFHCKDPKTNLNYKVEIYGINRNKLYNMHELSKYKMTKKEINELDGPRAELFIQEKQNLLVRSIFAQIRDKLNSPENEVKIGDGTLLNSILEPLDIKDLEKGVLIRVRLISRTQKAALPSLSTSSLIPSPPLPPRSNELQQNMLRKLQIENDEKKYEPKHPPKTHSAPTSPRPPQGPPPKSAFHSAPTSPIPKPSPPTTPPPTPRGQVAPELPDRHSAREQYRRVNEEKFEKAEMNRAKHELSQNTIPRVEGKRGTYIVTTTNLPTHLSPKQLIDLRDYIDDYLFHHLNQSKYKSKSMSKGDGLEDVLQKLGIKEFKSDAVMDIKLFSINKNYVEKSIKAQRPQPAKPTSTPLADAFKILEERKKKGLPPK